MCLASTDPGGPKRCSSDSCAAIKRMSAKEVELLNRIDTLEGETKRVSFAEKKDRVDRMRAEIDTAVANLSKPQEWENWLKYASTFHHYSLRNQLLIRMQFPNATQVAGFKKWTDMNRNLVKGSKAIWITAMAEGVSKKDGDVDANGDQRRYKFPIGVAVYDVSQTEGDPVPEHPAVPYTPTEGVAPEQMHTDLEAAVEARGFTLEYRDLPKKGAEGWTDWNAKKVVVSTGFSDAHRAMILAHELAHIELNHGDESRQYHTRPGGERPVMEVEAESVAYVIGRRYGLQPPESSFAYITNWAQGDVEKVKGTADAVAAASHRILKDLPEFEPSTALTEGHAA